MQRSTSCDGAVAVMVAVFLAGLLIVIGAVAIDLGGGWSTQRGLVTDTDAMALGGARILAEYYTDCASAQGAVEATVTDLAVRNGLAASAIDAVRIACGPAGRWGTVRVDGTDTSTAWFNGADLDVAGTTTAMFERSGPWLPGLAVCENQFLGSPAYQDDPTGTIAIGYRFQNAEAIGVERLCPEGRDGEGAGAQPGGWGWLAPSGDDWAYGATGWHPGDTGTNLINDKEFNPGRDLLFPLFDTSRGQGAGHEFRLSGWGSATVEGCTNVEGATPGPCNGARRWIVLSDVSLWFYGDDPNDDPRYSIIDVSICGVRAGDHCPTTSAPAANG